MIMLIFSVLFKYFFSHRRHFLLGGESTGLVYIIQNDSIQFRKLVLAGAFCIRLTFITHWDA